MADPMTVVLTREQALHLLTTAAAEQSAIQANLLDLDGSFGKRLLAGATLSGQSARQWDAAAAGLATLWDNFAACTAVLDRATILLNPPGRLAAARLEEASELLIGPSVRLVRPMPPLGQRELTAGGELRLSLVATVREMKRSFTEVAGVLTAAETVWNVISDQLRPISDELSAASKLVPDLADAELASALDLASTGLRELRAVLNADPLALWQGGQVDTGRLDRLKAHVAAITTRTSALARLRAEADRRIAEVSGTVAAARQAWQDAMTARSRAAVLVIVTNLDPLPNVSELGPRQRELAPLLAAGRLTRLESELDALGKLAATALRRCRAGEQAAAGLVGRRDELRGLLGAYRAKAAGLGAIEDPEVDARYRQAHDLLWTAPCDLAAATSAVTGYQQAIGALGRGGGRT